MLSFTKTTKKTEAHYKSNRDSDLRELNESYDDDGLNVSKILATYFPPPTLPLLLIEITKVYRTALFYID